MQWNGASRKRSADRGRGGRLLPATVERLESRYAMDGGGMSQTVALPPYSSALGIGFETRLPVVVAPVQAAAAVGVAAPAPSTRTVNTPSVIITSLQAGAPTADEQTQGTPGVTVKTRDPIRYLETYPGPLTAGALREILDPWPGSLTPNGPGTDSPLFEHEYFHKGVITIDFSDICMPDKLAKVNALADAIFADIRDRLPEFFNPLNKEKLAEAEGPTFIDGDMYYSFKSKGWLAGGAAPALGVNGEARDGRVYVIMNDLGDRRLQATTLGNHMLVGHRYWQVDACEDSIRISTWTDRERRNGWLNEGGFWFWGPTDTKKVWKNFLITVADTHKRIGTIDGQVSEVVTSDSYGPAPVGRGAAMRPKDQDLFAWVYGDDTPFAIA
jgi:hypothetical protein